MEANHTYYIYITSSMNRIVLEDENNSSCNTLEFHLFKNIY